jgi:hypothetical protein
LADLPFVVEDWENPTRDLTLRGLMEHSQMTVAQFQSLPLYPAGEGSVCVSPSQYFVATPPKSGMPTVPDTIRLCCISAEAELNLSIRTQVLEYLQKVGRLRKFEIGSIIEEAVIPFMADVGPELLIQFLFRLTRGSAILKNRFDWFCLWRVEVARQLRVPVRDGSSRAPIEAYAGQDWTGDDYLEEVFGVRSDRAFLSPPPNDPEELDALKRFYEWIGVGCNVVGGTFCSRRFTG